MFGTTPAVLDPFLEAIVRGLWLIITGSGRCGTGYIAKVLTSAGVKCTHEGVFHPNRDPDGPIVPPGLVRDDEIKRRIRLNRDNVAWGWQAESSWLAAPYLDLPDVEEMTIMHLVRHPKKVIDSQMRMRAFEGGDVGGNFWPFILEHMPELATIEDEFVRAGYFYVEWNRRIEAHADIFWRVEDDARNLLDKLGIDWQGKKLFGCKRYNHRAGWRPSDVDLSDINRPLRDELVKMTESYGYEWPAD